MGRVQKGENYFTDFLFYQDPLEAAEDPSPENLDSGNEADTEPKVEEKCLWELNPLVTSIDKLDFNNTATVEGEWFINENLDLVYLSALVSDSVPSDTNNLLSVIDALTSFHAPVRLSFMVHEKTSDRQGAFFEVSAKHKSQKPILLGRIEPEPMACESSEDNAKSPQFSHYGSNACRMMEKMGYDLTKKSSLNFGEGKRTLLQSFVPKEKALDYYQKTRRGLSYVSTPIPSDFESENSLYHNHSSGTSS